MVAITIRRLSAEEIALSQALRFRVWTEQERVAVINTANQSITDDLDAQSHHWGAFDRDTLISSARLSLHDNLDTVPDADLFYGFPIPLPTGSLNRLVVSRSYRGEGIGRAMDKKRILFAQQVGVNSVIIAPVDRMSRVGSLLELGFVLLNRKCLAKWSNIVPIAAMYLDLRAS